MHSEASKLLCPAEVQSTMSRLSPFRGKPSRTQLLERVQREVQERQSQSLHRAVLLNLKREKPSQEFQRGWDIEIKLGNRPSVQVPRKTSIAQIFDRTGGKLVILGAEGAGKTTMLLDLAEKLATRAQADVSLPVPVLFNLSSWKNDYQAIADWLVVQLRLKYDISVELGKQWLAQQQLLPLLDGLDEVEVERQNRCIQAINQFLESASPPKHLVACSSFSAYKNCQTRFRLRAAILLKPLSENQIREYLLDARSRELWYSLHNDFELLKLAKTPLLLSMMTLGYEEILIQSWKRLDSLEEQRKYLLNAFVRRQMMREIDRPWYPKSQEPRPEQVRHWLVGLAKQMQQEGYTEFSPTQLSPSWLKTPQQQQRYQTGKSLVTGLLFGLIVGVIFGFLSGWFWAVITAIIAGASGMFIRVPVLEKLFLRWLLWQQGVIPWNYRRFLNFMTERLLLQKIGDSYQFIHHLLQEHFSQL